MAHKAVIPLLVGMMLLTGVCNTLLTKYQVSNTLQNNLAPPPSNGGLPHSKLMHCA